MPARGMDAVTNEALWDAAEKTLRAIGVEAGATCLDFGCGHGNYTVPLAKVVRPSGTVYALDKDDAELRRATERARDAGLDNVEPLTSTDGPLIALDDDALDVVILFDVLHSYYFTVEERKRLFEEIGRVASPRALLAVFPHHMEADEIESEVVQRAIATGFERARDYRGPLVHDDHVVEDSVLIFTRGQRVSRGRTASTRD